MENTLKNSHNYTFKEAVVPHIPSAVQISIGNLVFLLF